MFGYENYRQDLRKPYYPKYVKQRFYDAIEKIGIPDDGDRFAFITAKPKGNAGWEQNNNCMNAFEFKFNRKLWIRRSRKEKMPNVGAIEPDASFKRYHFHYLVKLKEIKVLLTDDEIKSLIIKQIKTLEEINSKDQSAIDVEIFKFDKSKANTKDDAFGKCIHYLVKTSQNQHNPLARKVYSKKEQQANYEKNPSTHTYFSQEGQEV
jgi:hypothetical protein